MNASAIAYRAAQHALRALTPVIGSGRSKLARGLAGRREAHRGLAEWGREHRDPDRIGLWVHAPSVGEGLQAKAVVEAFRALRDDAQVLYTHFSPSAEGLAGTMPADVAGYLPWDLPGPVGRVLEAGRPDAIVFTKTEVWPVLAAEARRRGACIAMIGGTLSPGAGRSRWPARSFLRSTWESLSLACVNTSADAKGFRSLGVPADAVHVTGDPGIDSAAQRARSADPAAPHLSPFRRDRRPTLVAGSTWPADDTVLIPALREVRKEVPDLRVVIAPHEPSFRQVDGLRTTLEAERWTTASLGEIEQSGSVEGVDVVVVDRVGVLAQLYTVGDVAYVGGGFHDAGLHSVLEPAAARVPVTVGPGHTNARAAGEMIAGGGAREVDGAAGLAEVLIEWLMHPEARHYAAGCAFGYIERHLGAADRTASVLADLLDTTSAKHGK
jgi:3-deoxy-D-manno-octulosonic-acid transferase